MNMCQKRRHSNRNFAATSVVRLVEAFAVPDPEQSARIILKPKEVKKRLPGTQLLIKLAKDREHQKMKRMQERAAEKVTQPEIDEVAVEEAMDEIFDALDI